MNETPNLSKETIFQYLKKYAYPYRKGYYFSFFLMPLTLFFDLVRPFLLKSALDQVEQKNLEQLKFLAILFLVALLFQYLTRSLFSFFSSNSLVKTISNIRSAVFQHILSLKMAYLDKQPMGKLMSKTVNDTEALREMLHAGITSIFIDVLTVFGVFVIMFQLELTLSPIIMISAPAVFILVHWFGKKLRHQFFQIRKTQAQLNAFMAEGISGVEIIQLFNYQEQSKKEFDDISRKYLKARIYHNVYDASLYAFVDAIAYIITGIVLYVGLGMRFRLIDISVMIVYVNLISRIFIPIRDLSGKFATIVQALAALQRIFSILETKEHIPQGEIQITNQDLQICFENVSFRYDEEHPKVLRNITFTIEPGEVIALVGATGSGKTTIGKLIMRAYGGYEGNIFVNNTEIRKIDYHSLRSQIAIVHQEADIFPGSIYDNITMFDESISEEKVQWALDTIQAGELIKKLAQGLHFEVKERGANLSLGQQQLIVFARLLVRDTPVIIMDEATSSVDSITEAWIQQALEKIFALKTVIIIAHRLSTIAAANQILVLKRGEIIEKGTHEQLLAQKDSYYSELIEASKSYVDQNF